MYKMVRKNSQKAVPRPYPLVDLIHAIYIYIYIYILIYYKVKKKTKQIQNITFIFDYNFHPES